MKPVDADKLIKHLEDCAKTYIPCQSEYEVGQADAYTAIADYVSDLEPVDAEPVIHAHWIPCEDLFGNIDMWQCSHCGLDFTFIEGTPSDNDMDNCPKCRAKMDEEEEKKK